MQTRLDPTPGVSERAPASATSAGTALTFLRRYLVELVALVAFGVGVWWRYKYIVRWHDPRKYVYSDMKMYVDLGTRLAKPGYDLRPSDVTHPPGVSELLAFFVRRDATRLGILDDPKFVDKFTKLVGEGKVLGDLVALQLGLAIVIPLAVGFLGWVAFGRRTGLIAVAVASLYYPFIEYGGYFLAEVYMMVLCPLVVGLYLLAVKTVGRGTRRDLAVGLGVAALGGLVFYLALAMKMVALPAVMGFVALHFVFTAGPPRKLRAMVAAVFLLAATPGTIGISQRCTEANDGTFCFGSNKSGADFLLGHYGRIQGISWKPKKGPHYSFGSPSAYQHGYRDVPEVPYGLYDSKANEAEAWKWIRKHPGQAVVLSAEHVADSFFGALPWPAYATTFWLGAQAALYLFIGFLLFPTGILLVDVLRQRGLLGLLRSTELAVVSPAFGVALAVAIATGEIRYRLPWDCVFIVLAIEFYRRLRIRLREPVAAQPMEAQPALALASGGTLPEAAAPAAGRRPAPDAERLLEGDGRGDDGRDEGGERERTGGEGRGPEERLQGRQVDEAGLEQQHERDAGKDGPVREQPEGEDRPA